MKLASDLPAIFAGAGVVAIGSSGFAINFAGGSQIGKVAVPKTSALFYVVLGAIAVGKLPRLNALAELLVIANKRFCVVVHDGVFNRQTWRVVVPAIRIQFRAFPQFAVHVIERLIRRWNF